MKKLLCVLIGISSLTGCPAQSRPDFGQGGDCSAELDGVALQKRVTPSIVRIESDTATGTGFVVEDSADGTLIATNYHVIQSGSRFDVIFVSGTRLGALEVVRIDVENDLALLRAPGGSYPGLHMASRPVELAQRIAAIGYPYVDGESQPSMTFEDGTITNTSTVLDGRTFIRTNANFNPGNSGGPVIDACGDVIGVVVAMHSKTERTGLIIPAASLRTLVAAQDAPRSKPETEIASRVETLETAVRYRRGYDVASMFSRTLLSERVVNAFTESLEANLQRAIKRVDAVLLDWMRKGEPYVVGGRTITSWSALPEAERVEILAKLLSQQEKEMVMLYFLVLENKVDKQTAMQAWLGEFVHDLFGDNPSFTVHKVTLAGDKAARTQLMIGSSAYWVFDWVYEWGDWRIDGFKCMRGCGQLTYAD